MRSRYIAVIVMLIPIAAHAQLLGGNAQAPLLLHQLRWDMSKQEVLAVCSANKAQVTERDSTITFDDTFFEVRTKTIAKFRNEPLRLRSVELRFTEYPAGFQDSLINRITRFVGENPVKAEKEKSALIFTLRMEIALWRVGSERITLLVAKRSGSIFDSFATIEPASK